MDERLVEGLRVLGDPLRLRLLQLLHSRGETCVCELLDELGTTQSNISSHLRLLRQAGLVHSKKIGKWVFYRLDQPAMAALLGWLNGLFDPATAASERSAEAVFACCQGSQVPLSISAARERGALVKGGCGNV